MSTPSLAASRRYTYIWESNPERNNMNEPKNLIRRNGQLGSPLPEVDPRSITKVDLFADSTTEGSGEIDQIQNLIEVITEFILSLDEEDVYDNAKWNRTVSRVSNWVYLRALWIRSNVALSMVVPYIYRQDLNTIGSEDFEFTGRLTSLDSLMLEIDRIGRHEHLLTWDIEDPHVVYIMRVITERLNLDRLLYLRNSDGEN